MSAFPPEIVTQILSRLPVKSLLRFRCVSKPWCAEIDGPDFKKLHLQQSTGPNSNLFLISEFDGTLYSVDLDSLDHNAVTTIPMLAVAQNIHFHDSCNGLILVRTHDYDDDDDDKDPAKDTLYLLNPSTRKNRVLPRLPMLKKFGVNTYEVLCLCYDAVHDDYKVFNVLEFTDIRDDKWLSSEARVYSLNSNSWRIIENFAHEIPNKLVWGAHLNGALHNVKVDRARRRDIVAFDIGAEVFNVLPLPEHWDKDLFDIKTGVLGGCLCVLGEYYPDFRTDIWVMKDYGVKESWNMLLSVRPDPYLHVAPIVYSKCGTAVLLQYDGAKLVWYDLRKKSTRKFRVSGFPGFGFSPLVCVGSLVPVESRGTSHKNTKQQGELKLKADKTMKEVKPEKHADKTVKKVKPEKHADKTVKKVKPEKRMRDDFLSKGFKLKL